jgi:hypothetical protein
MTHARSLSLLVLVPSFALLACEQASIRSEPAGSASPTATGAATTKAADPAKTAATAGGAATTTASAAKAGAAPAAAATGGYPLTAVKTIADNCTKASVIMATSPKSTTPSDTPGWQWTRQAMLANQQFKIVDGDPVAPMQVKFSVYDNGTYSALVAACHDGATCNQLAAMYKAVVRSSTPQILCGPVPGMTGSPQRVDILAAGNPKASVPEKSDIIGLCARLSACMIATDQSTPGNPGLECQKAPHTFKTSCATRYPCSEVMSCVGK